MPTVAALLLSLAIAVPAMAAQPQRVLGAVVAITDGDTLVVEADNGARERVRLIGIDTPETRHPSRPVQCFGAEATARTTELALGKRAILELDVQERDRYGRLLAYVWPDGSTAMLNVQLVAEGYAQVATYPPNVRYVDELLAAQRQAREAGAGLWSACQGVEEPPTELEGTDEDQLVDILPAEPEPAAISPERHPAPVPDVPRNPEPPKPGPPAPAARCHPSYPDFCIPPPPPDLDCGSPELGGRRNFTVRPPDPHRFDADRDGIGCER
jgi:micrococcal nuclease